MRLTAHHIPRPGTSACVAAQPRDAAQFFSTGTLDDKRKTCAGSFVTNTSLKRTARQLFRFAPMTPDGRGYRYNGAFAYFGQSNSIGARAGRGAITVTVLEPKQ